ncbi:MAG: FN3 associated domain-containing protein [Bacteroidota bacterium]
MTRLLRINLNIVFALNVLLIFFLVFESKLEIPILLQPVGRLHPLFLHVPIGLFVFLAFLPLLKKRLTQEVYQEIEFFTLNLTALSAVTTALMGLFLTQEGGYDATLLFKHKWLGAGLSWIAYLLLVIHTWASSKKWWNIALYGSVILMMRAGHFGGNLTHGKDYVLAPLQTEEKAIIASSSIYEGAIEPILKEKCMRCHNDKKTKGDLNMASLDQLLKGGKEGPIFMADQAGESPMIKRAKLPLDDKYHMPPEGKPQLTSQELSLLENWIQSGADTQTPLQDLSEAHPLYAQLQPVLQGLVKEEIYTFPAAKVQTVQALNGPLRTVRPIAMGSPALEAAIFIRRFYQPSLLEELTAVKDQLIRLDLSSLPIDGEAIKKIAQFENLEELNLNNSDYDGANLGLLAKCKKLKILSLSNTPIQEDFGAELSKLESLQTLYLWSTQLQATQIEALEQTLPAVNIETGFVIDTTEILPLSPPALKNKEMVLQPDEFIVLESKLPGTEIRYTLDGQEPDSIEASIYDKPFSIRTPTVLKAKVYKEGWQSSEVLEELLYPFGIKPVEAQLISQASPRRGANGGASLWDGLKGSPSNFNGPNWLGYLKNPLIATFDFGTDKQTVREVVISYLEHNPAYVFKPQRIRIWGGDNPEDWTLIKDLKPKQDDESQPVSMQFLSIEMEDKSYQYYKIQLDQVASLPQWHRATGERAHVFVDEIFFY